MSDLLALGAGGFALAFASVFVSTMVQRLTGQGFGLIAAPMLAIAAPDFLPATLLALGMFVGFGSGLLARDAVCRAELTPGIAGRSLGALVAAVIALRLPDPATLALIIAAVVYLAIGLSLAGLRLAISPRNLFGAGFAAGIMGTLTAIGAPPMAMLYQHEPPRRAAAMQNVFFGVGMVVSILSLTAVGLVGLRHLVLAAALAPAALIAMVAAQRLAPRVERARMRPIALGLAGAAATVLLIKTLI